MHLCQHQLGLIAAAERGLWPVSLSYLVILTKIRRKEIHVHMAEKSRIKCSVSRGYGSDFYTYSFLFLTEHLCNICVILLHLCDKYCEMASQANEKELGVEDKV